MRDERARIDPIARETASPETPASGDELGLRAIPPDPWDKVRELAIAQLDRFMSLEPKVLSGDPAAIHHIRVASRRLQQVLDLLYMAPRPGELCRLRRKLRRCRRALGDVRNCDVLLERVGKPLARTRRARRETWLAVQQYLRDRRVRSFEKALRRLGRLNLADFYVRLRSCLADRRAGPRAGDESAARLAEEAASPSFPERIAQELGEHWQVFQTQLAESRQDQHAAVIHAARLSSKRLRYLIEVIQTFEVPGSAGAVSWFRSLQRHLGDWHDLEVLERMMIEMVARPQFLRDELELGIAVEKLVLRNRAAKGKLTRTYFEMTTASTEFEGVRQWVDHLLASPPAAFART